MHMFRKMILWWPAIVFGLLPAMAVLGGEGVKDKASLKKKLTEMQYQVTQEDATEPPFKNAYWNHKEPGIYVDVVSGEALFSSTHKFKSGTGWPSFTQPIEVGHIVKKEDASLFTTRTEVRSKQADSHLGHVFDDGPKPTGLRYCINSAALRFVPVAEMAKQGYGKYLPLFAQKEDAAGEAKALFAGGCFWCVEADFEKLKGVTTVVSGYTAGHVANPSYKQVSAGGTGHTEAVTITYDPKIVSYAELLQHFWRNIDPLVQDQQFCDKGSQYRSGIYFLNDTQRLAAEASRQDVAKKLGKKIYTEIKKAGPFYQAEEYHQDYYKKNPVRYKYYRYSCGRDKRLEAIWGDAK